MDLDANGNPIVVEGGKGPEGTPPAKQEPAKVEPTKVEPKPFVVDTNLSAVEQTSAVLTEAGLDASKVLEAGKLSLADTIALQAKFGDAVVNSIAGELTTAATAAETLQKETDERLYGMCTDALQGDGEQTGEQLFGEVSAWAKDALSETELKEANALLAQGGLAAQLVMQDLLSVYSGTDAAQPAVALEAPNPANNKASGGGLSRSEYGVELNKALDAGHGYESPTVKKLQARRTLGAQQGI